MNKLNLLFICTSGYRAQVVCTLFNNNDKYAVSACGVHSLPREELENKLKIADKVICITDNHYEYIRNNFDIDDEKLINLDIADDLSYQEDKLLSLSKKKLTSFLT